MKWSNTLKQIVAKLATICLSAFDHFSELALKGLKISTQLIGFLQAQIIKIVKSIDFKLSISPIFQKKKSRLNLYFDKPEASIFSCVPYSKPCQTSKMEGIFLESAPFL